MDQDHRNEILPQKYAFVKQYKTKKPQYIYGEHILSIFVKYVVGERGGGVSILSNTIKYKIKVRSVHK